MIFSINNYGHKKDYFDKFLLYYNMEMKIDNDRQNAFQFAQTNFFNDYGFLLYSEIDLFLKELIEIKEGQANNWALNLKFGYLNVRRKKAYGQNRNFVFLIISEINFLIIRFKMHNLF